MIIISFWQDRHGHFRGFKMEGHAEFDEFGKDILCAAVSALAQSTVLGLKEVLKCRISLEQKRGFLRCCLDDVPDDYSTLLFKTLYLSILSISEDYKKYLKVCLIDSREVGMHDQN